MAKGICDLEIDSEDYNPLECAQKIKQALANGLSGKAFARLKQELT